MSDRYLDNQDRKEQAAIRIAIEAGTLRYCEVHDDILLEGGAGIEDAIRLGTSKFSDGELSDIFDSQQEMKDLIQFAKDYAGTRCERCEDPD